LPVQNLAVPHNEFVTRTNRHEQVLQGLGPIEARVQKLLGELVMLRLFDEFQEALSGVALRLACGTHYVDGTAPALLAAPARSASGARRLFETAGRTKPARPRWSKSSYINETTKYVLDSSNSFSTVCNANGLIIAEMQSVRNRIAHSNAKSRVAFAKVVQRHYGARLNHVSPGMLLLSARFSPMLLEQYLAVCRAILKGCAKA
jgi:hypothetical protein